MSETFASGGQHGDRSRAARGSDPAAGAAGATAAAARISGPADLLQAVPYLLGFHPHDSFVLLGLRSTRLVVTARLDLADLGDADLLPGLLAALARGGATHVIGVVYDSVPGEPRPWRGLPGELRAAAAGHGCAVDDVLHVADGRWWSYLCDDAACCPPQGRPVPDSPSAFVAEATFAGMVALPDRTALAATLEPLPTSQRASLLPMLRQTTAQLPEPVDSRPGRSVGREIIAAARRWDAAGADGPAPVRLEDIAVVRFGAALAIEVVRNEVWLAIERGRADGRALWQELARRLPGPYDAAPLFLFGWTSWRAGNGALAGIAADRAISSDPGYTAADLLVAVLSQGLGPDQVPRLRSRGPGPGKAA